MSMLDTAVKWGSYQLFQNEQCVWLDLLASRYQEHLLLILVGQTMLALITDKLQNQSLEDGNTSALPLLSPQSYGLLEPQKTKATQDSGQKVWEVPLNRVKPCEKDEAHKTQKSVSMLKIGIFNKYTSTSEDLSPGTPPAPPKKKHCRSLSVPSGKFEISDWIEKGPHVCKPIAILPTGESTLPERKYDFSNLTASSQLRNPHNTVISSHLRNLPHRYTPPESPVPRPASVSVGCCDNLFKPLTNFWMEQKSLPSSQCHAFENRSLSLEERISYNITSGSTPSVSSSINSYPSSPQRHQIPRCHSQPCVLHDRRTGIKRRRDYDRPALDFQKMTQTAYPFNYEKDLNITPSKEKQQDIVFGCRFPEEFWPCSKLLPISCSPLDSNFPVKISSDQSFEEAVNDRQSLYALIDDKTEPVRFIGDDTQDDPSCTCESDTNPEKLFPITDLDVDQIEIH